MEPAPLDYAPPPTQRRGVFVAGLLAHIIASYVVAVAAVAVAAVAMRSFVAGPPPLAIFVVLALAPIWVPLGFIAPVLFGGAILTRAAALCVYGGLFALGYRRLRRPRGT